MERLYEQHKQDSDEALTKIAENPSKYSEEAVYVCRVILDERNGYSNEAGSSYTEPTILEKINDNLRIIKNIILFWTVLGILGIIITVFSSCS
jgi:hypothetical protein